MHIIKNVKVNNSRIISVFLNLLFVVLGGSLVGSVVWHRQQTEVIFPPTAATAVFGAILGAAAVFGVILVLYQHIKLFIIYDVIMVVIMIVIAALGGTCLAADSSQLTPLLVKGWSTADSILKDYVQNYLQCCGFENPNLSDDDPSGLGHPPCEDLRCCRLAPTAPCCMGKDSKQAQSCPCNYCAIKQEKLFIHSVKVVGTTALITSLLVLFGLGYIIIQHINHYHKSKHQREEEEAEALEEPEPTSQYERF